VSDGSRQNMANLGTTGTGVAELLEKKRKKEDRQGKTVKNFLTGEMGAIPQPQDQMDRKYRNRHGVAAKLSQDGSN